MLAALLGTKGRLVLLADIRLEGCECVPWSAPRTIRVRDVHVHLKDKGLIAWQDAVREEARSVYRGEPYEGPVAVVATFRKATPERALWDTPWYALNRRVRGGDLTNFWKAAEDAIATRTARKRGGTGATFPGVIANDSQVVAGLVRKAWGPADGLELRIYAVADGVVGEAVGPIFDDGEGLWRKSGG